MHPNLFQCKRKLTCIYRSLVHQSSILATVATSMETEKDFKVGKFPTTDSKTGNNIKKEKVTREEEDEKSEEDDCYEIDPLDFTKKLLLEVSDNGDHNEVVLVAAKGPVALRDFPHPRHLCGNLPFNSTLHEKHCKQCYCIVCEIPAPCSKWKKGIDAHCHESKRLQSQTSFEERLRRWRL